MNTRAALFALLSLSAVAGCVERGLGSSTMAPPSPPSSDLRETCTLCPTRTHAIRGHLRFYGAADADRGLQPTGTLASLADRELDMTLSFDLTGVPGSGVWAAVEDDAGRSRATNVGATHAAFDPADSVLSTALAPDAEGSVGGLWFSKWSYGRISMAFSIVGARYTLSIEADAREVSIDADGYPSPTAFGFSSAVVTLYELATPEGSDLVGSAYATLTGTYE